MMHMMIICVTLQKHLIGWMQIRTLKKDKEDCGEDDDGNDHSDHGSHPETYYTYPHTTI